MMTGSTPARSTYRTSGIFDRRAIDKYIETHQIEGPVNEARDQVAYDRDSLGKAQVEYRAYLTEAWKPYGHLLREGFPFPEFHPITPNAGTPGQFRIRGLTEVAWRAMESHINEQATRATEAALPDAPIFTPSQSEDGMSYNKLKHVSVIMGLRFEEEAEDLAQRMIENPSEIDTLATRQARIDALAAAKSERGMRERHPEQSGLLAERIKQILENKANKGNPSPIAR